MIDDAWLFGTQRRSEFTGNALHENMGAPRLSSTHATITERRHCGTISSSHHHRCVLLFHPVPTPKTTTPVPLSYFSVQPQLPLSLAGDPLYSFLPRPFLGTASGVIPAPCTLRSFCFLRNHPKNLFAPLSQI